MRERLKQQVIEMTEKFPGFRPGLAILQVLFSLMTTTENMSCFAVVRAQLISFIKSCLVVGSILLGTVFSVRWWHSPIMSFCQVSESNIFWGFLSCFISFFRPCSLLECCVCEMVKSRCLPIKSELVDSIPNLCTWVSPEVWQLSEMCLYQKSSKCDAN